MSRGLHYFAIQYVSKGEGWGTRVVLEQVGDIVDNRLFI